MAKKAPARRSPPFKKGRRRGPPGLVLHWPLNDGPTGELDPVQQPCKFGFFRLDLDSTQFDGRVQRINTGAGALWNYDPRIGGYCLNMNRMSAGGTLVVELETNSTILKATNVGAAFSAGIWFYLQAITPALGCVLFSKGAGGGGQTNVRLGISATTFLPYISWTVGAAFFSTFGSAAVNLLQWNFLMGTYDGTNQRVYLNGQLVGTGASGTPDAVNTQPWGIGARDYTDRPPLGLLWNAMVFNRALKGSEIKNLYYDPLQMTDDPPVVPPVVDGGGGPPPPVPDPDTTGPILIGRPAPGLSHRNQIISNRGGRKPLVE